MASVHHAIPAGFARASRKHIGKEVFLAFRVVELLKNFWRM
jgi:hypothetical protein